MRGDPPNELVLETQNRILWFMIVLFLTVAVNFATSEYKKYQGLLNERARMQYDGRLH